MSCIVKAMPNNSAPDYRYLQFLKIFFFHISLTVLAGSIHSVAEALVLFLQALAEPVIPSGFHPKCLKNPSHPVLCRQVSLVNCVY